MSLRVPKFQGFTALKTILVLFSFIFLLTSSGLNAQDEAPKGDHVKGKSLFNANCASCHALNRNMTGPALANVEQRLYEDEDIEREWFYKWIKNSAGLIASGDAYANKVYNQWNQVQMNAFPLLSNEDIDNILAYTAYKDSDTAATPC